MIRAATEDDVLAVKMLWAAAAEEQGPVPRVFKHDVVEMVPWYIKGGNVLVAEEPEGQVCGFVAFIVAGDIYSGTSLYVAQDMRHKGLAHELLEAAHAIAASKGARRAMTLLARGGTLVELYKSAGYQDSGHVLTKEF